ncbi:MAG: hypothetical protein K2X66_01160 [Cyanobacteria bacterium]|nr:hypothetical protein [Cyanobacteriota bacterium]
MGISSFFPGIVGDTVLSGLRKFSPVADLPEINYRNFATEIANVGASKGASGASILPTVPLVNNSKKSVSDQGASLSGGLPGLLGPVVDSLSGTLDPFGRGASSGGSSANSSFANTVFNDVLSPNLGIFPPGSQFLKDVTQFSRDLNGGLPLTRSSSQPLMPMPSKTSPFLLNNTTSNFPPPAKTNPTKPPTKTPDDVKKAFGEAQSSKQVKPLLDKANKAKGNEKQKVLDQARTLVSEDLKSKGFDVKSTGATGLDVNGQSLKVSPANGKSK